MSTNNKIVLITGGASGIGKIIARIFLEKKLKVIIWDINKEKLNKTLSEFSGIGEIYGFLVDVSDFKQASKNAEIVKQNIGTVDILINNAGIITGKYFHEHSIPEIDKTLQINTNAPMYLTSLFLKDMINKNYGHICNIASSAALVSNPKMSVYAASKWAITAWSDTLRLEMKQLNKNINVTTILPYYINTGMFEGVESKIPILDPETTAIKIVKAIEKNKKLLTIPGWIYRITRFGQAVMSINFFDWFTGSLLGIYNTMKNFKTPHN